MREGGCGAGGFIEKKRDKVGGWMDNPLTSVIKWKQKESNRMLYGCAKAAKWGNQIWSEKNNGSVFLILFPVYPPPPQHPLAKEWNVTGRMRTIRLNTFFFLFTFIIIIILFCLIFLFIFQHFFFFFLYFSHSQKPSFILLAHAITLQLLGQDRKETNYYYCVFLFFSFKFLKW